MTVTSPFTDPVVVAGLLAEIQRTTDALGREVTLMEVCGTHTHAVARAGLRQMLPRAVRLVSGPGCPVCVTPVDYLDRAVALAQVPGITVCTFGDLMRVPSSTLNLEEARALGAQVEVVYSPRDAVDRARRHPDRCIVFLAVGFETTVPTIAAALAEAETTQVPNFLILPGNKVMPPPMTALAADPELAIDGFLLPGHVSVITGSELFRFIADEHGVSGAVVGFDPADILRGVAAIVDDVRCGSAQIHNLYGRVVDAHGNRTAWRLVERFFQPEDAVWRGFGIIPQSGLGLRAELRHRDARSIEVQLPDPVEPAGCRCGEVLRGSIDPPDCPLFGNVCSPDSPTGACMVSSEGSCAAWYRHERYRLGGTQ